MNGKRPENKSSGFANQVRDCVSSIETRTRVSCSRVASGHLCTFISSQEIILSCPLIHVMLYRSWITATSNQALYVLRLQLKKSSSTSLIHNLESWEI